MISTRIWLLSIVVIVTTISANRAFDIANLINNHQNGPLVLDEHKYVKPDITVAELLEVRGFTAKEYKFTTQDGYILRITRGTNPLINKGRFGLDNKLPILFLSGSTVPSTTFMLNSAGVRPKVYDNNESTTTMTVQKLAKMVRGDESVKSLPFLAMNFGYEVWILDRRGYQGSRTKLGNSSSSGPNNRTLADAIKSLPPANLLGNALDDFALTDEVMQYRHQHKFNKHLCRQGLECDARDDNDLHDYDFDYEASKSPIGSREPSTVERRGSSSKKPVRRGNILQVMLEMAKLSQPLGEKLAPQMRQDFIDTFDTDFWSFSLDEQAKFDLPGAIDLILTETGHEKVHTVGLSSGGALLLLALAEQPELANKISKAIIWASPVSLGHAAGKSITSVLTRLIEPIKDYVGPIPFPFVMPTVSKFLMTACNSDLKQRTFCVAATDPLIGTSGGHAPVRLFMAGHLYRPTSFRELVHLTQFSRLDGPCKFEFGSSDEMLKAYGQVEAPCYDLGQIKLRNMSFYVGATDTLAHPDDLRATIGKLSVPSELKIIEGPGGLFNHLGCILHKDNGKLIILPSLLDLERSDALN